MLASRQYRFAFMAAFLAFTASPSFAATSDTDTLTIKVTVQEACTIAGTTLDFGTYTGGQQDALNAQGQLSYNGCATGTLTIALDGGAAGDVANRAMTREGGGALAYQLYRNSGRTQLWGSGAEAHQVVLLVPGSGAVPIYGRIPGGQEAAPGAYTDTVNITMTF